MFHHTRTVIATIVILILTASQVVALGRVARRYNVMDFYGGTSSPVGKYESLADFVDFSDADGRPTDVDGDVLYDPTFHLGFNYGQLRNDRMLVTVGFRWTKIEAINLLGLNTVGREGLAILLDPRKPGINQYDFDFNFNYMFLSIAQRSFAPYVGVDFRAGITSVTAKGFESESRLNTVLAGNFGAEIKLWENAKKRAFLTVASVNSYDLLSSGDRPKYFNLGAALKYYFRP